MTSTVPPDGGSLHRYPGIRAWLLSACPSGTKSHSPIEGLRMELALIGTVEGLWTGGFFRILKGLSIIRIVQPGAGVHQQRGRGRGSGGGVVLDMLM
jgi:hypothetical protein